jgi:hypothetical protein
LPCLRPRRCAAVFDGGIFALGERVGVDSNIGAAVKYALGFDFLSRIASSELLMRFKEWSFWQSDPRSPDLGQSHEHAAGPVPRTDLCTQLFHTARVPTRDARHVVSSERGGRGRRTKRFLASLCMETPICGSGWQIPLAKIHAETTIPSPMFQPAKFNNADRPEQMSARARRSDQIGKVLFHLAELPESEPQEIDRHSEAHR